MSNVLMWKAYEADGAIGAYKIVHPGASAGEVKVASAAGNKVFGVTGRAAAKDGERVEVAHVGIAEVEAGAAVAHGDLLKSDGDGNAIPAAAAGDRTIGVALVGAADGDVLPVLLSPGQVK